MVARGGIVSLMIGVAVASIVGFNIAIPIVANARESADSNLSTSEKAVAGLITLFIVLGLAFWIGTGTGVI